MIARPAKRSAGKFRVVEPTETSLWNEYVRAHRKGTIFQTAEMMKVYEAVPQYEPFARAAINGSGEIVALLSAVRIETLSGMASSLASRSIFHAEPLCNDDEEGIEALVMLLELHDEQMRSRTVFSEVRPIFAPGPERKALERAGYEWKDYLNYVVNVSASRDELWECLSRSCRQNVERCRRQDVQIHLVSTPRGVKQMYKMIQASYRRAKIPLADISLFHAALEMLPSDTVQIRVATHHGKPVAGGIVLNFKDMMYAWYGGTTRKPGISPFDGLTWDEISWASENGLVHYDFGGAGWPEEDYGPRAFKAKFGGQLVNHGRYVKIYSGWRMAVARTSYRMLQNFVSSGPADT